MEGSLSAADVMALTKGNEGTFGEGIWGIILLLIIAGVFSGGLWGGNAVAAAGLTRAEMDSEFAQRDIFAVNNNVLENRYASAVGMAETQKEIMENRYANQLATAGLQKDILLGNQTLQAQMATCSCDIKSLVRDEAQSIKDLINNNTIQSLRDQLNLAEIASANAVQTQNLLGTMGTWRANPSYSGCGCNCNL